MRPRNRTGPIAQSNDEALAAFIGKKFEIDAMLDRLRALSDDHFNVSPDGRVGR